MPEQPKLILIECIFISMITNDVEMNAGSSILVRKQSRAFMTILYFPIPHDTLCLPPKFCINHCF